MTFDVQAAKQDFPILKRRFHGKPVVYLDSAATSQRPKAVIDACTRFYEEQNSNVHRAVYELGAEATMAFEDARAKVARFLGASPRETIFTRGATEAVNLVFYAWAKSTLRPGDRVVTTVMEHHSNLVPWLELRSMGVDVAIVDVNDDGTLAMDEMGESINDKTKLVAVTHASNVLGTINPVKQIARMAHDVGALCLVDGAQSAPHMKVNFRDLGCDFYAVSGHKMLAPTGIGCLLGREEVLKDMPPFHFGGDMIREVHLTGAKWNDLPYKFEAGTQNMAGAVGFAAACDYLERLGMDAVREHEKSLTRYALQKLAEVKGLRSFGPTDLSIRGGVVSFVMDQAHPHDVASILDAEAVCVRSGHHCAMPLMERLDVPATTRASFYVYNDERDVDRLVEGLRRVEKIFERRPAASAGTGARLTGTGIPEGKGR
ncbi:MAG TPA: cysteine desulfurase [Candidatus Thermoplasmatota archaeon]|nr:cysteine desulfurase [Candidatus Thermoplasmatota archaeon]